MRFPFALVAVAIGSFALYSLIAPPSSVTEQEVPDFGLEVVDSPENIKVNGDQFESGADVDFDLSAYFADLFDRVNAFTDAEINYFSGIWGTP